MLDITKNHGPTTKFLSRTMAEPVKEELEVLVEDDEFEEFEEGTGWGLPLVN